MNRQREDSAEGLKAPSRLEMELLEPSVTYGVKQLEVATPAFVDDHDRTRDVKQKKKNVKKL